jgi:predicted metal-binding membrane protein
MGLLVAFGLMNLTAMIVLAGIVLVEKTGPTGRRLSHALGIAALLLAVVVIFEPQLAPGLQPVRSAGQMGTRRSDGVAGTDGLASTGFVLRGLQL